MEIRQLHYFVTVARTRHERILDSIEAARTRVRLIGAGSTGLLRVGATGLAALRQLPQLARIAAREVPGLVLRFQSDLAHAPGRASPDVRTGPPGAVPPWELRPCFPLEAEVELPQRRSAVGRRDPPSPRGRGAITIALCGSWEHEPPCPLAPHHTRAERRGDEVRLRVLFAAGPDEESRCGR